MKVAIVTSFPRDPRRPTGGVETVSVNLVRALAGLEDVDVHVVTTDRSCAQSSVRSWEGASVHRLPARQGKLLAYALGDGRRQVQAYLGKLNPDVIHAHDFYGLMTKGLDRPRVFTIHGFIHEDTLYAKGLSSWLRARLWRKYELENWAEQPHIVSISPYVRERLQGVARGTIHDIENPIAPECFDIQRAEQAGTIFCAAAICERKNTLGLVQALDILARCGVDARLRWAGPVADSRYDRAVNHFVEQHGLSDRVTFLGALSVEEVRQELAEASVFALASFEEGAPMGVAEAMAAGVPVVTSNRCGMPYMVRNGESGFLVNPYDTQDTAHRLRDLMATPSLCAEMGRCARQQALERYHPDRVAERTRRVYRSAVHQTEA